MKEPLISVLVPIYKIDRYLGICVESLLNQTYKNLEIILVDDGSPDRCPEICDLYASKDERIKVIHKENGGLVSARKAALMAAKGSYIGYVDGDDWVGPGFYHSLYSSIKESDADIAIAGFSRDLFSSTKNILNAIPSGVYEGDALDAIKKQMIADGVFYRHGITTYLWNKLFKREVIEKYQMEVDNRITIGEDAATVYPAIMASKKIVITDNCAYHYRQREDSMLKTATNHNNEYLKVMYLHDYMKQSLKGWSEEYDLLRQTEDLILSTFIIRTGGTLKDDGGLANFPFAVDFSGKKLAVYGAGTFGQQLVRRLKNENQCTITTWVDDDYWEYRRCCMDVDPIEQICKVVYDAIVIALIDPVQIEKIKHLLYDYGVEEKMIITVSSSQEQRDKALKLYLQEAHEISEGPHS
jgi:glycosyltransferase involved in cell wall biosynthesis